MMANKRKRRTGRRQRGASLEDQLTERFYKIPFRQLRNPIAPVEILDAGQIEKLHQASIHILQDIGLDFFDDEALDLWRRAGARVDRSSRHVWLDGEMVLELVAKAPSSFTWRARNPQKDMHVGENSINFLPAGGMVYANDLNKGRRLGTAEDYANLLKLIQSSNALHGTGVALVELNDVPVSIRHLRRMFMTLTLCDKPTTAYAHGRIIPADIIHMVRIAFGEETGDGPAPPVVGAIINVNSPLRYDERMLGGLITYARAGQVTIITPFILAGAMSPITIAAALAQQNAEVLAGVALTQLIRPGAPVVYGGFSTNADMRSGSPSFGTPESAWVHLASTQLARRYNLPSRGNGGLTNANLNDVQSAQESLWTLWPAVMGHTNYIMHAAGWLEAGLAFSFEKFIIDIENLASFQHFLGGFSIDEGTLALEAMAEVGPGGHHFGTSHTQARYNREFHEPILSSRLPWDQWQAAGSPDAVQQAHNLWQALVRNYQPPPMDPGVKEALEDFAGRRERELEGVDLYY
jgi:trimethylamine--corrinoid protein Co-methyltransferase